MTDYVMFKNYIINGQGRVVKIGECAVNTLAEQSSRFVEQYNRRQKLSKKIIVNAGLLKAGKSSLLNALTGKNQFAADVIRATVENQRVETDEYILLDTPGLDATDEDTGVALKGYEDADIILFVHNVQEGEFTQTEIDSIRQIAELFGELSYFFQKSVLVLTHKDQDEEHLEETEAKIQEQCTEIFGTVFAQVCCVDSVGYMKGLTENKKMLMQDSGIDDLKAAVKELEGTTCGLWQGRMLKEQRILIAQTNKKIKTLQKEMPAIDSRESTLREAKQSILDMKVSACQKISKEEIDILGPRSTTYRYLGDARDWQRYSSESSARSAGKSAISKAIDKMGYAVRSDGSDYIEKVEKYILQSGKMTEYRNYLMSRYEAMLSVAENVGVTIKTPFKITLKDFRNNVGYELDAAKSRIRYPSFSSAEHYANSYSCNMDIDEHEETEWVPGLFGSDFGAYDRTVTKYSYNVSGALDDVASDAADIINDAIRDAKSAVQPVFRKMKDDLCEQFRQIANQIDREMDAAIQVERNRSETAKQKAVKLEQEIQELRTAHDALRNLKMGVSA